eukprot:11185672-Prorocentrum_lima.AAC.1
MDPVSVCSDSSCNKRECMLTVLRFTSSSALEGPALCLSSEEDSSECCPAGSVSPVSSPSR